MMRCPWRSIRVPLWVIARPVTRGTNGSHGPLSADRWTIAGDIHDPGDGPTAAGDPCPRTAN